MRYTVTWAPEALAKLTELWLAVGTQLRDDVTRSSDDIDRALRTDPDAKGRHHSEGLFSWDAPPLRAFFTVNEPDRLVTATDLALIKRP